MTTAAPLTRLQRQFVDAALKRFPGRTELTRKEVVEVVESVGMNLPQWLTNDRAYRVKHGVYRLPVADAPVDVPAPTVAPAPAPTVAPTVDEALAFAGLGTTGADLVPAVMDGYVPFGAYNDVLTVLKTRKWYPVYITGLAGNGKTTAVEQACAKLKREFVRVNVTAETCEDDLLGGFRLINGDMRWVDGPVIVAMKRGAVLLLDEVDLGTPKIMCLQPVLEGKPIFVKKTNTWVAPAEGFNAMLTGNTKGKGDDTGKFVGANVMNEAMLDRAAETIEQEYPPEGVEVKIVANNLRKAGVVEGVEPFAKALVKWANTIRQAYAEGAAEDIVTTRRLNHAAAAYGIYGDRLRAVEKVCARFGATDRAAFIDLYRKIDAEVAAPGTDVLAEPPTEAQVTMTADPTPADATAPVAAPVAFAANLANAATAPAPATAPAANCPF